MPKPMRDKRGRPASKIKKVNWNVPLTPDDLLIINEVRSYYLEKMQLNVSKTQVMRTAFRLLHNQFYPNK